MAQWPGMRFLKLILKIFGGLLALLVVAALVGYGVFKAKFPKSRPVTALKVESTPERVARGKYLSEHQLICVRCHSQKDNTLFGRPYLRDKAYQGGDCLTEADDMMTTICTPNITQDVETGIGGWTDDEILRALREGIAKNGNALFPQHPYPSFKELSDDDAHALVAFLRTIPPARNAVPRVDLGFPNSLIMDLFPQPITAPVAAPDRKDTVAYGRYLTRVANCENCHTPQTYAPPGMEPPPEEMPPLFSGGNYYTGPSMVGTDGWVVSANLTPDIATGIGAMVKEQFIGRFTYYRNAPPEPYGAANRTVMPWLELSGMTEEDLGAIYDYLKTVKPVNKLIDRRPASGPPEEG